MNFRCLIVDDEPLAVDLLEDFVLKVPFLSLAGKCYDALQALTFLRTNPVDILLLDINMPHLTGLEFVNVIPSNVRFIFTTAYTEFAVESYDKNAVDYLLKPITFERFLRAVTKLKDDVPKPTSVDEKSSILFIKSGKKIIQVDLQQVSHIEGMGDYAVFHYNNEKIMVGKTLKELESLLPSFIQRIHLSFFININQIKKIEDNHVAVSKVSIPISNKYRDEFLKRINSKLL